MSYAELDQVEKWAVTLMAQMIPNLSLSTSFMSLMKNVLIFSEQLPINLHLPQIEIEEDAITLEWM